MTQKKTREQEGKLSARHRLFIDYYFSTYFNATEAYRLAGYKGDYAARAAAASRLLKTVKVQAEIARRMAQHMMTADEALARLAAFARGDIADVLTESGTFDMQTVLARGTSYLVKEHEVDDGGKVRIKIEDRQSALATILKQWQLTQGEATERVSHTIRIIEDMSEDGGGDG